MSDPTTPTRPSGGLRAAIASQLQDVHPDVPADRMAEKVGRTLLGSLFVLIGLALLALLVLLPGLAAARRENPVPLAVTPLLLGIGGGFAMVMLGATVWSSELVRAPVAFVLATLRGVFTAWRGQPSP